MRLANVFGAKIYVPALILDDTDTPAPTNVYTMYFTYYSDFGSPGVMVIMLALGGIHALVYHTARRGHPLSIILYGFLLASLLLTNANDPFLTGLSSWLQITVISLAIYSLPP